MSSLAEIEIMATKCVIRIEEERKESAVQVQELTEQSVEAKTIAVKKTIAVAVAKLEAIKATRAVVEVERKIAKVVLLEKNREAYEPTLVSVEMELAKTMADRATMEKDIEYNVIVIEELEAVQELEKALEKGKLALATAATKRVESILKVAKINEAILVAKAKLEKALDPS